MKNILVPPKGESINSVKSFGQEYSAVRLTLLHRESAIEAHALSSDLHPTDQKYADELKSVARRDEFLRSRWLMRAMAIVRPGIATRSESGAPHVDADFVASITHKAGSVVVAASLASEVMTVGVDLELTSRVRPELAGKICVETELALLKGNLALAFAAKEALFKAHYPIGRRMFWFHDATITAIDWASRRLTMRVNIDTSPVSLAGSTFQVAWTELDIDDQAAILALSTMPRSQR